MSATILQVHEKQTKDGKPYLDLVFLGSDQKEYKAKVWNNVLESHDKAVFRQGNIIDIKEFTFDDKYNQFTFNKIELLEAMPIGLPFEMRELIYNTLIEYCMGFKNASLDYIRTFLVAHKEAVLIAPAAINHHHNYIGGFLQHTLEVVGFAKEGTAACITSNKTIDGELVLAGAICHDFGKVFEYSINEETGLIKYNEEFKKQYKSGNVTPHILFGWNLAMLNGCPSVANIVASHHKIEQHGSMREPETTEEKIVHTADYTSSFAGFTDAREVNKFYGVE